MWLEDPKTKTKSVTLTLLVLGFLVCLLKLIFSGMSISHFVIEKFSGSDFAMAVGALGGVYALRRAKPADKEVE